MSSHITSPYLQKTDPDKYGQRHPIETPVLVQSSLILLNEELQKMSLEEKESFLKANELCPSIVTDDHKIVFLRCEQFNIDMAARRLCKYWVRRVQILGSVRAFLPLTSLTINGQEAILTIGAGQMQDHQPNAEDLQQETSAVQDLVNAFSLGFLSPSVSNKQNETNAMNMSSSLSQAVALGFMQILPAHDDQGRTLIWIEPRKLEGSYSRAGILHSIWYLLHCALHIVEEAEDPSYRETMTYDPQKFGIVFLIYLRDADPLRHFDISLIQSCAESIRGALPVRVSAIHFLEPPLLFDALYEVVQLLLGDLLKKRVHVHSYRWGSKYEISVWKRFGIAIDSLPTEIGGNFMLNPQVWMQQHGFKGLDDLSGSK